MLKMNAKTKIPETATITNEHKKLVEKARESMLDKGQATPIALLGTEEVVGTYYWILCKVEVPEIFGGEVLTVYKIYQSPQGEVYLDEASAFEFSPSESETLKYSA